MSFLAAARARVAGTPTEVELHETALLLGVVSITAGLVHAVVVPDHAGEGLAHGAFFVAAAAFQLGWAAALLGRVAVRATLRVGIAGNLAIVAVWALSRTVGVPVGPDAWTPEAVGALDLLATYDELLLAAGSALLLAGTDAWRLKVVRGMALVLAVATLTALFGGAGHHHG
ncbi:MAG TPA: hypothetical protein VK279_09575 [Solirubrobacteraceae bacterium]|nr:hypothetical protein [Solirubrobacteraceae bacterium]